MESLAGLRKRRAFECRLTQDRALGSLDEAEGFLGMRGMLTRLRPPETRPSRYAKFSAHANRIRGKKNSRANA